MYVVCINACVGNDVPTKLSRKNMLFPKIPSLLFNNMTYKKFELAEKLRHIHIHTYIYYII